MLPILNIVGSLAGAWLEGRQEKAKAKQKLAITKIEAQAKRVEQDGNWDEKAMDASDNAWKDEAWTLTFIAIIIFSFIPYFQPFVARGIEFLATFPEWLQWSIMASIGASFGLKSIGKFTK